MFQAMQDHFQVHDHFKEQAKITFQTLDSQFEQKHMHFTTYLNLNNYKDNWRLVSRSCLMRLEHLL